MEDQAGTSGWDELLAEGATARLSDGGCSLSLFLSLSKRPRDKIAVSSPRGLQSPHIRDPKAHCHLIPSQEEKSHFLVA